MLINRNKQQLEQKEQKQQESNKKINSSNKNENKKLHNKSENETKITRFFNSTTNIFMLFLTNRFLSSYFNLIWDCDETYNYWDPLHFLTFKNGLQTWEYSPKYSLRSYLYLFIHLAPIYPLKYLTMSKITLFYSLRFLFALITSYLETNLYKSLIHLFKSNKLFNNVALIYLLLSITNVGMFLSTTSFLPSTFSMYLIIYAYTNMYMKHFKRSIFAIGLAILLAWPFVLILGIPVLINFIFLNELLNNYKKILQQFFYFLKITILFACFISIPIILVDSYMFGKFVFAPLNIFIYNVFESNKGPDLYGREPFSYFVKNLFLNFNILYPFSILLIIPLLIDLFKTKKFYNKNIYLTYLAMFLWLCVFMTRPHKEERFMYPIYPLILINSSLFLAILINKLNKLTKQANYLIQIIVFIHFILSLSRLLALLFNYSASMQIYFKLNEPEMKFSSSYLNFKQEINVCVSKEWYRFPSYFFIPENTELHTWNLKFLPSDFKGQLPGYFNPNKNMSLVESSRYVDNLFNDLNKEVVERYVNIEKCDFFIDTDYLSDDDLYTRMKLKWKTIAQYSFLDSSNVLNNNLFKTFYIPGLYEKYVKFTYFKLRVRIP